MPGLLEDADEMLRGRPWTTLASGRPMRAAARLLRIQVVFGAFYGAVMGSFGGWQGDRWLQAVGAAGKVPVLLIATTALALPSFFVLHSLLGLRSDFGRAFRAVLASQAGLTVVLASLAPLTVLWYASSNDYPSAILFNGLMFGAASLGGGQLLLRRAYRPLIARDRRHRLLLRLWLFMFAFVGIQMGWLLRPFVGDPNQPVELFREKTWGNAYEFLARLIWRTLFG